MVRFLAHCFWYLNMPKQIQNTIIKTLNSRLREARVKLFVCLYLCANRFSCYKYTVCVYKHYLIEVERLLYVERTPIYIKSVFIPLFVEPFMRAGAKHFYQINTFYWTIIINHYFEKYIKCFIFLQKFCQTFHKHVFPQNIFYLCILENPEKLCVCRPSVHHFRIVFKHSKCFKKKILIITKVCL